MSSDLVYSTDQGDLRKRIPGFAQNAPLQNRTPPGIKKDGVVRVQRESKGRAGKTVTVVYGLPFGGEELLLFAKKLKQQCGVGGSVEGNSVIIQGDKVTQILALLEKEGLPSKRAGG
jgi:translation initiation factor 1